MLTDDQVSTSTIIKIFSRVNVLGKKLHLGGCATNSAKSEVILINKTFLTWNRINDYHNGQSTISNNERHVDKWESLIKIVINCHSSLTPSYIYIWFVKLHNQWCRKVKYIEGATKVGSAEEPRSAPLVPSICWTIFAKRLWQFWAQESENVWLFRHCTKSLVLKTAIVSWQKLSNISMELVAPNVVLLLTLL